MDLQLSIDAVGSTRFEVENAAVEELERLFIVDSLQRKFDNVVLCLPNVTQISDTNPNTNWLAYAYVGWYLSVFNGDFYCANEGTQLHELGHNWGLQ